jgi:hypothetical protein
MGRRLLAAAVALGMAAVAAVPPLAAQPPVPGVDPALDAQRAIDGERLEVSLITMGPSDVLYERFGHNAIAIRDTVTGEDLAYNWGVFDFDQPNFLRRFLTGDTRYWMATYRTGDMLAAYREANRSIRVQRLALTPVERAALRDFVRWNAREENRYYRYDYYRDNCATRVRDAIDRVLGGRIRSALDSAGTGRTWRSETARLTATDWPAYAGIQVALGRRADVPLTRWEEGFLPEHFAYWVQPLAITRADGARARLVAHDTVVFEAERVPMPTEPPERLPMAALLGLTMAGLIAWLADSGRRAARALLSFGVGLWYGVGGVLGTLLLLAGTVTRHDAYMGANTTLLQLHPLLLVATGAVPFALARGERGPVASVVTALIAAASLLGVVLQLLPATAQRNGIVLAVTVPVHVALWLAVRRLDRPSGRRRSRG